MTKQIEPIAHQLTSVAEIRAARLSLAARERALQAEGAALYASTKAGAPPRPESDHSRMVRAHVVALLNGSTPPSALTPAIGRDAEIVAELAAVRYVDSQLARREEVAADAEAQQWAVDHAAEWRSLCAAIVIAAHRLAALEDRARRMLEPVSARPVKLAMGSTIGSGLSLLGIGDPLLDLRTQAVKEQIVTPAEIRKAQQDVS